MPRVAFTTLGCKVNQSETDLLARQFAAAGYECVRFDQAADVYVVNTCTVTHVADRKSRQALSQARRLNPDALVVATGCYASIVGEGLADDRTLVIRNRDKERVLLLVEGRLSRSEATDQEVGHPEKYVDMPGLQDRSRPMVKVQDGCDSHCAYCIIPRARGRSRSMDPDQVIRRIRSLVSAGHVEIVITGVDLGSYGEDNPSLPDLGGLLQRVLKETEARRLRVSSLEPGDFKKAWLGLWSDERLCRHLHVPLQSGSAGVLARMGRSYTPEQYGEMVATCRDVSGMTITTDVMVGFPGESDVEFEESYQFTRSMAFDGMHVFKYSRRSGTLAARMPGQVDEEAKQGRSRILREEAAAGSRRLLERHMGRTDWVAWETENDGILRGTTGASVRVYQEGVAMSGRMSRVQLGGRFRDGLWGEPAQPDIPLIPA